MKHSFYTVPTHKWEPFTIGFMVGVVVGIEGLGIGYLIGRYLIHIFPIAFK